MRPVDDRGTCDDRAWGNVNTVPTPEQDTAADTRRARFEELTGRVVEPLRRYLARRTDPATAEEALADTLLVCWRRLEDVPDLALPWAFGVARKCLDNVPGSPASEPGAGPGGSQEQAALARLHPGDAELLRLWAWEQLEPVEIGQALELPPDAVEEPLRLAQGRWRDELGVSGPAGDDTDQLRARLRAADPAATLPPADPAAVDRFREGAVTRDVLGESRADGTRGRSRLTWVVAAAAALVIVGVGLFVLTRGDEATDPPPAPAPAGTTELTAPTGATTAGRCLPPAADLLAADADVAFDGTVTSVAAGEATLTTTHWYAGRPTETVVVRAPSEQMQRLLSAVDLQEGERYLVAGDRRGSVMLCGFSDHYDPRLAALYAEAFGE